ncbi:MAG: recombinase RecA [Spirochaetaceae bacterium]|jgi:recombination protein RecA|nr:recombinase RecA [Spirochaetaceae bacterium]
MAKETVEKPKTIKDLDALVKNLQVKYGSGSISVFGKNQVVVERVPIDSFYLSELLGGGYPRGRMIEIYGPESSGKTTLACYFAGQCQKHYFEDKQRYGVVAYIDVEHALDPPYAATFGLDMDKVLFSQPDSAEQALDILDDLVESDLVDMVVVDSVAALSPQQELDGEMGDQTMGLLARLMSKACRKLQSKMTPKSASIVWINQIRMKIGIVFGNPEVTSGGNALKFFTAVRMTVRAGERIEDKENGQIGMISRVKTIKNKVAPPFRTCDMKIIFGEGYQVEEEYVQAFVKYGIIRKSGGWYTVALTRTGTEETPEKVQGEEKVLAWLKEHPEIYAEYRNRLMAELSRKTTAVIVEDTEDQETGIVAEQEKLEREAMAE